VGPAPKPPNPQSPIPNPQSPILFKKIKNIYIIKNILNSYLFYIIIQILIIKNKKIKLNK